MERWDRWDLLRQHRVEEHTPSPSSSSSVLELMGVSSPIQKETAGSARELDAEDDSALDTDAEIHNEADVDSGKIAKKSELLDKGMHVRFEEREYNSSRELDTIPINSLNPALNVGVSSKTGTMNKRKMRALDFLSFIPMEKEREDGGFLPSPVEDQKHEIARDSSVHEEVPDLQRTDDEAVALLEALNDVDGEKLVIGSPGLDPTPIQTTLPSESPAVGIRLRGNSEYEYISILEEPLRSKPRAQVEQTLLNMNIHDSARIYLISRKSYPSMVLSVVKHADTEESRRRKKLRLTTKLLEMPRRRNEVPLILPDAEWLQNREGTSYARYFNKRWAEASNDLVDPARAARDESWDREYHPEALDDPRIRLGKHRVVQGLDGFYFSVLPYTKKKDMKAELNEVFREQHPELPAELTLSKIRNLKKEVIEHVRSLDLEISTAALAIIYFEKLVFKGVVRKQNRKLIMSVCLLIAFKFNEPKRETPSIADLLQDIERVQSISPKTVLEFEFPVFGHLLFSLKVETEHVLTHFSRLLKQVESTPTEYLGEDLAEFYFPERPPEKNLRATML